MSDSPQMRKEHYEAVGSNQILCVPPRPLRWSKGLEEIQPQRTRRNAEENTCQKTEVVCLLRKEIQPQRTRRNAEENTCQKTDVVCLLRKEIQPQRTRRNAEENTCQRNRSCMFVTQKRFNRKGEHLPEKPNCMFVA